MSAQSDRANFNKLRGYARDILHRKNSGKAITNKDSRLLRSIQHHAFELERKGIISESEMNSVFRR